MLEYMLYTRALENVILWGLLVLPLIELSALCVLTLCRLPFQRRKGLLALFIALLVLSAVLFGGAWALRKFGLTWRTWFQEGLGFVLWLVGLITGIMTVGYAGRWLSERGKAVKSAVTGLSVSCLVCAMLVGTLLGGLWAMGPGEQVVAYRGEKMILSNWVWHDTGYKLYEYHGLLVRGAGPVLIDWDWQEIEGAVVER